jgi:hypothetical protein
MTKTKILRLGKVGPTFFALDAHPWLFGDACALQNLPPHFRHLWGLKSTLWQAWHSDCAGEPDPMMKGVRKPVFNLPVRADAKVDWEMV